MIRGWQKWLCTVEILCFMPASLRGQYQQNADLCITFLKGSRRRGTGPIARYLSTRLRQGVRCVDAYARSSIACARSSIGRLRIEADSRTGMLRLCATRSRTASPLPCGWCCKVYGPNCGRGRVDIAGTAEQSGKADASITRLVVRPSGQRNGCGKTHLPAAVRQTGNPGRSRSRIRAAAPAAPRFRRLRRQFSARVCGPWR